MFDSIFKHSSEGFNGEITFEKHPDIIKLKDSKVLIVGAGKSTDIIDWKADDYDHIISCNNFFLNKKLSKLKVMAATIGMNVNTRSSDFNKYVQENNTLCIFEPDHGGKQKLTANSIFARLRYNGRIGAVPRLILYAMFWGAKEIHIVGMDGFPPTGERTIYHAFEGPKLLEGTIENLKNLDKITARYHRQYILFWDYVFSIGEDVVFQNLAENLEYNMLSPISQKEFPLK